jgi:uncharacterized membrane protein
MAIGPVEYMVVGFPGNQFKGDIAPALAELVESKTIRIIDLAFVMKDADGNVVAMELEELQGGAADAFQALQAELGDLVNEEDLEAVGEALEPNSSALLLVWEDVWATRIKKAIQDAGGELFDLVRIPAEIVDAALEASTVKLK